MIEQVMIFTLGLLVAGLGMLIFLPAFWRRAMRLSRRRLEMQMPLSMDEIVAERDQLRAEFAVTQRRIEQKTEALNRAKAEDMSELGRRATRIAQLDESLGQSQASNRALEADLATARRAEHEAIGQSASLSKALYDTDGVHESQSLALARLGEAHQALNQLADERRTAIAGLETRVAGLELTRDDLEYKLQQTEAMLVARDNDARTFASERDATRAALEEMTKARDDLSTRLEAETLHARGLDANLAAGRADLEQLVADLQRRSARIEALEAELALTQDAAQAQVLPLANRNAAPAADAEDMQMLRRAISDIGHEVVRLHAEAQTTPASQKLAARL